MYVFAGWVLLKDVPRERELSGNSWQFETANKKERVRKATRVLIEREIVNISIK